MGYDFARTEERYDFPMMGYDFAKPGEYDSPMENIVIGCLYMILLWDMILLGELPLNGTDFRMGYDFT